MLPTKELFTKRKTLHRAVAFVKLGPKTGDHDSTSFETVPNPFVPRCTKHLSSLHTGLVNFSCLLGLFVFFLEGCFVIAAGDVTAATLLEHKGIAEVQTH